MAEEAHPDAKRSEAPEGFLEGLRDFDAAALGAYGGLGAAGVQAHYYHRPLEVYLDAFLAAGPGW